MLDAVQEQVLDLGLLSIVESMARPQLLVVLLNLLQLLLKYQDVQVSRAVVGIEEPADLPHSLLFRELLLHKEL